MSIVTPKHIYDNVQSIDVKMLKKSGIRGICLDMDNTVVSIVDSQLDNEIKKWVEEVKMHDIMFCLVSNNPDKTRIQKVSKELEVPYVSFALKPFSRGFLKAKKIFNMRKNSKMAVIGDQIFTDILGANILGMLSIYVKPISVKDHLLNRIKRPLEEKIIKRAKRKRKIM